MKYKIEKFDFLGRNPVRKITFSNGAVVIHQRVKDLCGANASVSFLAGSRFERENQWGIAHLIEHMLFKGGAKYGPGELPRAIEFAGGDINAYTTKEILSVEALALSRKMPKVFSYLLELAFGATFPEAELKKEKSVVLQEIREDLDDNELVGEEVLFKEAFNVSIGHPITGKMGQVKNYTKKDLQKYYKKYCRPERMVITIVSNNQFTKYLNILDKFFESENIKKSALPIRPKLRKTFKNIPFFNKKVIRECENSTLILASAAHCISGEYRGEFNIINLCLGAGMSSRLFSELREKEGLVYGIDSDINTFFDCGNITISLSCQDKDIKKIKNKVKNIFKRLAEEEISLEEFNFYKEMITTGFELSMDTIEERCHHFSKGELLASKILNEKEIKKIFDDISPNDIKKVCKEIYHRGLSTICVTSKR